MPHFQVQHRFTLDRNIRVSLRFYPPHLDEDGDNAGDYFLFEMSDGHFDGSALAYRTDLLAIQCILKEALDHQAEVTGTSYDDTLPEPHDGPDWL